MSSSTTWPKKSEEVQMLQVDTSRIRAQLKERQTDAIRLRAEVEQYKTSLKETVDRLHGIMASESQLRDENARLSGDALAQEDQLRNSQNELEIMRSSLVVQSEELEELQSEKIKIQRDLKMKLGAVDGKMKAQQNQIAALKANGSALDKLRREHQELRSKYETLRNDHSEIMERYNRLNEKERILKEQSKQFGANIEEEVRSLTEHSMQFKAMIDGLSTRTSSAFGRDYKDQDKAAYDPQFPSYDATL